MSKDLIQRLTSRKFLLAGFGILVVLLQAAGVQISPEQRDAIIELIMIFTIAEGTADAVKAYVNK